LNFPTALPAARPHLFGLTRTELAALAVDRGFARVHASWLWNELYLLGRRRPSDFVIRDQLPARYLDRVFCEIAFDSPSAAKETRFAGRFARKYLLALTTMPIASKPLEAGLVNLT
jgi:hypothetical protein